MRTSNDANLTFMTEGEPPVFTRLNVSHPNVTVVNEADEVRGHWTDFGIHACARTLALNLNGLHRQSL